jgi:hypothetical protein
MPDLSAVMIELLIQGALIGLREMTMIFLAHSVLFPIDGLDISAVMHRLPMRDLTFLPFPGDAMLLAIFPPVDLIHPRMIFKMSGLMARALGKRSACNKQGKRSGDKCFHCFSILSYLHIGSLDYPQV